MKPSSEHPRTRFKKLNLSEVLVAYLKEQILNGELNPGDRLVETKIAEDLEISQTPVREAIRQLSGEGIVTLVPHKGPIVRSLDMKDVYEIYSLRAGLEGMSMRFAVQWADPEEIEWLVDHYAGMERKLHDASVTSLLEDSAILHRTIVSMSKHSRLVSMYHSLSFQISLVNRILGKESTKQKEVDQHRELIVVLQSGDPAEAERVIRQHIYRSYLEFVELQTGSNKEFSHLRWY
ncbi:MAG: GntR family transcriptional regulator [Caldilineaceae bacterium]|nr:GntR family transcriptional regulator [Caldilineaceae bacterium]